MLDEQRGAKLSSSSHLNILRDIGPHRGPALELVLSSILTRSAAHVREIC
jgi:hypothetical protein